MSSIHTLMFGWEYPPMHLGGLGVACQGLVQGLRRNGVDITLVLPHTHKEEENHPVIGPTQEDIERVLVEGFIHPYDTFETYLERISTQTQGIQEIYGKDLPSAVAHYEAMSVQMTKDANPDIVHCHDWMTYGAAARSAAYHGKPMVAHIHATELDRTHFQPNQWIYDKERWGFNKADRIIAVSQYTKDVICEHYGVPADKVTVVHNGASDDHVQSRTQQILTTQKRKKPLVLFLGRMTIQKGPVQFLEMAAEVHKHDPDVQFVMAGDGNMMEEIIARACDMGLQDNVLFTGKVDSKEAQLLYKQADVFVMPSVSEPFGLVALESVAHGTPVILSKQSGASEVVEHSFIVDFWDTGKMADCVLTVLREEALSHQLSSKAVQTLEYLTWPNQAGHVHNIYKELL